MRLGGGVALALLAIAAAGCAPNYVTNSNASVLFLVTDVNKGLVLDSDIRTSTGTICPDYATVTLAVQLKNPGTTDPSNLSTVIVNQYQIQYTRSDGRGVEGQDVPYSVSAPLTASIAPGATLEQSIQVVRRQAKLEMPLSGITGVQIVTMSAQITVYGTTVSGQAVTASGRLQIDFADYGDTNTSCPTQ